MGTKQGRSNSSRIVSALIMNITVISPNPVNRDGIARFSLAFAEQLSRDGNNVLLLTPKSVHNSDINLHKASLSLLPWDIVRSLRLIIANRTEVVHVQYAIPTYGIMAVAIWSLVLYLRVIHKMKILITLHEVNRETDLLKVFGRFYFYLLSLISNKLIVHTAQAKKILTQSCWVNTKNVTQIPLFIYPKGEMGVNIKNKSWSVLCFGYIHVDKGIQYLIEAMDVLKKSGFLEIHDVSCCIAGDVRPRSGIFKLFESKDRSYKKMLEQLVLDKNLSNYVSFLGFVENSSVYNLMASADIFVLPYTKTEQSGVLHTVLSYEKPVIASKTGGLHETLADAGVLVEKQNPKAIADAISSLISDKNLYKTTVQKYKQLVTSLSLENITQKTISMYRLL